MKTSPSNDEEHDRLSASLRRDAARIQEPQFDPALHHATLRRIRAMEVSADTRWSRWWKPILAGAAVLALCIGLWISRTSQTRAQRANRPHQPDFAAVLASTQAAVARVSSDASSPLPAWMSPTGALLDPPYVPSINPKHRPGNKP